MGRRLTEAQRQLRDAQRAVRSAKGNKFHAQPVVLPSGERFDSTKEYRRWLDLRLFEHAGRIRDLRRQVDIPLVVNRVEVCIYRADFTYEERVEVFVQGGISWEWRPVVEDSKGVRTAAFRLKSNLYYAIHRQVPGVAHTITET